LPRDSGASFVLRSQVIGCPVFTQKHQFIGPFFPIHRTDPFPDPFSVKKPLSQCYSGLPPALNAGTLTQTMPGTSNG
jgi:hypothetical protein